MKVELHDVSEVKIVSADINTLPDGFLDRLEMVIAPEYRDQDGGEHLYGNEGIMEAWQEDDIDEDRQLTSEDIEALKQLQKLMDAKLAAYVRFVNP